MDLLSLVLVCFVVFLVIFSLRSSHAGKKLPPGPRGLPIVGSILSLREHEIVVFGRWRKEYGELVYFNAGLQKILLLNTYRTMKAAYMEQADSYSGRPDFKYLRQLAHNSGIVFKDGPVWQEHRRFILHSLRDFGFGRPVSERIIDTECENLLRRFDKELGKPLAPREIMTQTINNVVSRLTFGERTGIEDPRFKELIHHIDVITNRITFSTLLPVAFPILLKIPPLLAIIESISPFKAAIDFCHDLIRSKIDEHVKDLGPDIVDMDNSQAKDVCDALLIERTRLEKEGKEHTFTDWQILRNLLELFLAGTDTTSTTMTWAFFYLSTNPDVQRRMHEELDEQVGRARRPAMKDRTNLHYTCAVMDEILRCSSILRSGIPRRTLVDTEINGYFIPANTVVMPNIYLIHHDPELWERPNDFWPGHFLDEKGNYKASQYFCAFSSGKRVCLGESLARMEIFMFLAGIMQAYTVRLADPNADVAAIEYGTRGNIRRPAPHKIILEQRQS